MLFALILSYRSADFGLREYAQHYGISIFCREIS